LKLFSAMRFIAARRKNGDSLARPPEIDEVEFAVRVTDGPARHPTLKIDIVLRNAGIALTLRRSAKLRH